MRQRLLIEEPAQYLGQRDNFEAFDHASRTFVTAGLVACLQPATICDPACGDASILEVAYRWHPFEMAIIGDLSVAQMDALNPSFPFYPRTGDLLDTMVEGVDLVVLTEILEHLTDPDVALRQARETAGLLVASSPVGDPEQGGNPEHLWAWDEAGYEVMLQEAGWKPIAKLVLTFPGTPWDSQIWVAH